MTASHSLTLFRRDVLSAVLFVAAAESLLNLGAFIARDQLKAPAMWIGLIGSAGYWGYLWNLFFGRITATLSLRRGMLVLMLLCTALSLATAYAKDPLTYCSLMIAFQVALALFEVQYNTTIRHLYGDAERPKRLSRRRLAVSLTLVVLLVGFGRMTRELGHTPAFVIASVMMLGGAFAFRGIRLPVEPHMEQFNALQVARIALRDPALRRVAAVLTLYGWVGAGTSTLLVLLYQDKGLGVDQVGVLAATSTAGVFLSSALLTPRLRFAGGLSNYRWCYLSSGAATLAYFTVGMSEAGWWTFPGLLVAQLCSGVAVSIFDLAMKTTGINLAPEGKTTLYVNTLLIVQGLRGMIMPLLVAATLSWWGMGPALSIYLSVGLTCAAIVMIPNIDALAKPQAAQ